ncbi:MAG: two-component sensor histidine kinase [Nocardia sp.]|uniref:sensor histidine kinase n=1 Tax=Nocardia sp. TaxID=1821 RepID=UPI0026072891|nr:HAMP domain-containing sensor histidine kinase [Nocardia sp.]MCU1648065.1 two-component sensor histidine kinase [Nocardia sp.]
MRAFSLRTRVAAAAALGASVLVAAFAVSMSVVIARNNVEHLDRQLDTASALVALNADTAQQFLGRLGDARAFAITLHRGPDILASTPTRLPPLSDGYRTLQVGEIGYRVKTSTITNSDIGPYSVSVAAPVEMAQSITRAQQGRVLFAGIGAIAVATGLGWLFGGAAIAPLVELSQRLGDGTTTWRPVRSGVREANQLAASIEAMLDRIAQAQDRTAAALETARTFSAHAAHELRTPLTAMRTDLEVMYGLALPATKRTEILTDVLRKQAGIEATITALELLARGELAQSERHVRADLIEIADRAVADAARLHPDIRFRVRTAPPLEAMCSPTGIRLALDNAITNAVRHGRATRIDIRAERRPGQVRLTVDDDGTGIPEHERQAVFTRFYRGVGAARDGSGLGLALVAQQAELHDGSACFTDSPLGGVRLALDLADPGTAAIGASRP